MSIRCGFPPPGRIVQRGGRAGKILCAVLAPVAGAHHCRVCALTLLLVRPYSELVSSPPAGFDMKAIDVSGASNTGPGSKWFRLHWDSTLNIPAVLGMVGLIATVLLGVGANRERLNSQAALIAALDRRDEAVVGRLDRLEAEVNTLPERIARLEQQQAIDSVTLRRVEAKLDRLQDRSR